MTYEEAMTDQGLFKWLSKVVSYRDSPIRLPIPVPSEVLTRFVRINLGSASSLVSLLPPRTPRSSLSG